MPAPSPVFFSDPLRATVLEIGEHGERVAHDRIRGTAGDVRDEPEAAAVVLGGRFVQGLRSDHGALRTNPRRGRGGTVRNGTRQGTDHGGGGSVAVRRTRRRSWQDASAARPIVVQHAQLSGLQDLPATPRRLATELPVWGNRHRSFGQLEQRDVGGRVAERRDHRRAIRERRTAAAFWAPLWVGTTVRPVTTPSRTSSGVPSARSAPSRRANASATGCQAPVASTSRAVGSAARTASIAACTASTAAWRREGHRCSSTTEAASSSSRAASMPSSSRAWSSCQRARNPSLSKPNTRAFTIDGMRTRTNRSASRDG